MRDGNYLLTMASQKFMRAAKIAQYSTTKLDICVTIKVLRSRSSKKNNPF